jgi:hypothetical protein
MNNRETLINLMSDYGLDRRDLAELVRVERAIVDDRLAPGESSKHIEIPDMAIELLTLKLNHEPDPDNEAPSGGGE